MDRPGSGLRRLTLSLVVMNVGALLAGGGSVMWRAQGDTPVVFNAEKIQLLEDVLPEKTPQSPESTPDREAGNAQQPLADCRRWASLDADGIAQVRAYLRQSGVADADYDLQVDMRLGWWVFIPPLESIAALQVVMEDARSKGVKDMAPVRSGVMLNALALGTFPNLDGATRHAQEMLKRGLRDVRYAPRPGAGAVRLVVVNDSAGLGQALEAGWPPGLAPGACKLE